MKNRPARPAVPWIAFRDRERRRVLRAAERALGISQVLGAADVANAVVAHRRGEVDADAVARVVRAAMRLLAAAAKNGEETAQAAAKRMSASMWTLLPAATEPADDLHLMRRWHASASDGGGRPNPMDIFA